MKLNDLELIVVSMRAAAGPAGNPDVTFYKVREEADGVTGKQESFAFVEWDLDPSVLNQIHQHRVLTDNAITRAKLGDYSLPVHRVDFYASGVNKL